MQVKKYVCRTETEKASRGWEESEAPHGEGECPVSVVCDSIAKPWEYAG